MGGEDVKRSFGGAPRWLCDGGAAGPRERVGGGRPAAAIKRRTGAKKGSKQKNRLIRMNGWERELWVVLGDGME